MRKIATFLWSIVIVSMIGFGLVAGAEPATNGTTGSCTWALDGTVLTISGNGAMGDYDDTDVAPWGTAITQVIFDGKVTKIGNFAFNDSASLAKILLPDTAAEIGVRAFGGCVNLTDIYYTGTQEQRAQIAFAEENESAEFATWHYNSCIQISGHTYTDEYDTKCNLCAKLRALEVGTITEDGITYSIQPTENGGLATITDCEIGKSGEVTLSKTIKNCAVVAIGDSAFEGCNAIKSLSVASGIKTIGESAFTNCIALKSIVIPNSVTSIGGSAFTNCVALSSITIPNSVTTLGGGVFTNCTSLKKVILSNRMTAIGDGVFTNCTALKEMTIPSSIKTIGIGSFMNCSNLEAIIVPSSVTSIGDYAFSNCTDLEKVTLPNSVTAIGNSAFSKCSALTKVTIPNRIKKISDNAFMECSGLTKVTVPSSVTTIGSAAFAYCTSLTDVVIPNSVTKIDRAAFCWCTSLTKITMSTKITSIADDTFYYCLKLASVTIPDGVTSIGNSAFNDCNSLKEIVIPKGVTTIGQSAFYRCTALSSVVIPYSIKTIGTDAFAACDRLEKINVSTYNKNYSSASGVLFNKDKTRLIRYPGGKNGAYAIPATVTEIEANAFGGCAGLTAVEIPNSVKSIGENAFCFCEKLRAITLGKGVKTIGENVFSTCLSLTDVWYTGSKTNKNAIVFDQYLNRPFADAVWHYDTKTVNGHVYSYVCDTNCDVCGATRTVPHSYKTTMKKASLTANGSIIKKCTLCNKVASNTVITKPKTFTLSTSSYIYNGSVKMPNVFVKDANGKSLVKNTDFSVTYDSGRLNVGTYKVTVKFKGNYSGTKVLSFKIVPQRAANIAGKLSTTTYTYNGKAKTPALTLTSPAKATLKKGTDYTVVYDSGRIKAGTYKVTVTLKGNYTGTKTLKFKIKPVSVSKCTAKLAGTTYTYNGKIKTPAVTMKYAGKTLKKGTDYTVTYAAGRKNVGTYKVTVKMKGNYTGTKTLTFKINPAKTTVSKLTAGKKSIAVTIAKKTAQVTGYQVQYSTSKSFSKVTTKTISSYKTTKYTLKSLTAKKTYYVRVRTYKTVGKTKYYSAWSAGKSVKTK